MFLFNIFLVSGLLMLPLQAQMNLISPSADLNMTGTTASVTPPQLNNSLLSPHPEGASSGRVMYRWSIAAVLGANAADAATSWKAREANPVVSGQGNQFGMTSLALKSGLVGTSLFIQYIALRHRPDLYKRLAWMNLIMAGGLGGVASHNMSVR